MASLVLRRPGGTGSALVTLDILAHEAGVHPELARRFVTLGLVARAAGTWDAPLFDRRAAAQLARAGRLRRDLGVGYAGAALACELLARIDDLEERLRRYEPHGQLLEVITWTSID